MAHEQTAFENHAPILVRPFAWKDWAALWQLNNHHLAEHGIGEDSPILPPDFSLPYDEANPRYPEMDMARIDQAYLKARGNFWIAWRDDQPVGHVGAQDHGAYVELRRMYVRQDARRRGIGSLLVQALIEHCQRQQVGVIKLWTEEEGPGRFLYAKLGFRQVEVQGDELNHHYATAEYIRMCLDLRDGLPGS